MLHIPIEDRVLCFTPTPVLLTESVRFQTIYEDLSTTPGKNPAGLSLPNSRINPFIKC